MTPTAEPAYISGMASYLDNPTQAVGEAIDRTLRAQEWSVRGQRVKRPDLDKLIDALQKVDQVANVSPTMCGVGMVTCPTSER